MLDIITLVAPDSFKLPKSIINETRAFMQRMLNRLVVGQLRYGDPKKEQKYLTRMKKELEAYDKTGNAEQLINIANYCILEWMAPEHPQHHFDPKVNSVTRKEK